MPYLANFSCTREIDCRHLSFSISHSVPASCRYPPISLLGLGSWRRSPPNHGVFNSYHQYSERLGSSIPDSRKPTLYLSLSSGCKPREVWSIPISKSDHSMHRPWSKLPHHCQPIPCSVRIQAKSLRCFYPKYKLCPVLNYQ